MTGGNNTKRLAFSCNSVAACSFLVLFTILLLTGCQLKKSNTETVNIDEIVWKAFRDPVGFDTYLDAQTLDPRTSGCLRQHRDAAYSNERNKLLECSVILEGSPALYQCHQEADAFHNNGVIMNGIASAIDGPGNFGETQAYAFLVDSKSTMTEADWNAYTDSLRKITPPYACEYKGEEKWFWE